MDHILDAAFQGEERDFATYRAFDKIEYAQDIIDLFIQHQLPYRLEKSETIIDSAIVGSALYPKNIIKLLPKDFKKANQLIEDQIREHGIIPEQHYLWDFLEEELHQVVLKPEEWSVEDQAYAKLILAKKGIELDPEMVSEQIEERMSVIRTGKKGSSGWMVFYLVGSVLGALLLTPFLVIMSIGMGWYYWKGSNIDPYGQRYPTFDKETQTWGMIVFYVGISTVILSLIFWISFDWSGYAILSFPNLF